MWIVRNWPYRDCMAIARFPTVVLDCPEPEVLARFYATMFDWKLDTSNDDGSNGWIDVRADDGQRLSFQRVEDYSTPTWPSQEVPQQMHLDVVVDDLDSAEAALLALGATRHEHQPGSTFRVLLDPAGHPFCLCTS
jgi:hypothetical protein